LGLGDEKKKQLKFRAKRYNGHKMEAFHTHLLLASGLFACVQQGEDRFLVYSKVLDEGVSWVLICTDLRDGWEAEFFHSDVMEMFEVGCLHLLFFWHPQSPPLQRGVEKAGWNVFFRNVVSAFAAGRIGVEVDDEAIFISWPRIVGGSDENYWRLPLHPLDRCEVWSRICDIVFDGMIPRLQRQGSGAPFLSFILVSSLKTYRKECQHQQLPHQQLYSQTQFVSNAEGRMGAGDQVAYLCRSEQPKHKGSKEEVEVVVVRKKANSKGQVKRRLPGYSLVNPHVKRHYCILSDVTFLTLESRWRGTKGGLIVTKVLSEGIESKRAT
jgi:hypothetical protein